jgi:cell division protein ZapA
MNRAMDDKFLIHVEIAGRGYGLRINRSEEQIAREAVKQIREKMSQYRKVYPEAEEKDLLAMVAFQLSIENLKFEDRNDIDPFTEKVEELTNELENYLKG